MLTEDTSSESLSNWPTITLKVTEPRSWDWKVAAGVTGRWCPLGAGCSVFFSGALICPSVGRSLG